MVIGIAPYKVVPCVQGQKDFIPILRLDHFRELVNVGKPSAPVLAEVVVIDHGDGMQPVWTLRDIRKRRGVEDFYGSSGVAAVQAGVDGSLFTLHTNIRRVGAVELPDFVLKGKGDVRSKVRIGNPSKEIGRA